MASPQHSGVVALEHIQLFQAWKFPLYNDRYCQYSDQPCAVVCCVNLHTFVIRVLGRDPDRWSQHGRAPSEAHPGEHRDMTHVPHRGMFEVSREYHSFVDLQRKCRVQGETRAPGHRLNPGAGAPLRQSRPLSKSSRSGRRRSACRSHTLSSADQIDSFSQSQERKSCRS